MRRDSTKHVQEYRVRRSGLQLTRAWESKSTFPSLSSGKENKHDLVWVELIFTAFLLLVLVRVQFGAADSEEARRSAAQIVSDGVLSKQLAYTATFMIFIVLYLIKFSHIKIKCVSIPQILMLAWILISCSWAVSPSISLRRAILLTMVFCDLVIGVNALGIRRATRCIYIALAIVIIASLISVFLFSFAVHPGGEIDPSITGSWRGIMVHKNTAGGVAGMAVILFLHHSISRGKFQDWAMLVCSVIFILGTRSKTSIGFLLPTIVVGLSFRHLWRTDKGRITFLLLVFVFVSFGILLAWSMESRLIEIFNNPLSFTGRGAIWKVALMEIADHPFFGAGYSSFWAAGPSSTLYRYMINPFIEFTMHSHNGFLEVAVTTGLPGLILAILASIVLPLRQIFEWDSRNIKYKSMLFSIILFGIAENCLETQLYTKDREIWIIICASVLLLQLQSYKKSTRVVSRRGPVRFWADATRPPHMPNHRSSVDRSVGLTSHALPQQSETSSWDQR
jgi:exopolysaccharide production protein ExoQ